jgi:hypothetical protein
VRHEELRRLARAGCFILGCVTGLFLMTESGLTRMGLGISALMGNSSIRGDT